MQLKSKVVILCGGMGTRLREETEYRPKPLVEIGGRPILWHIMKIYSHHGFKDFVLCLGYKGHMIKEYFLNYRLMNADFTLKLGSREEPQIHDANLKDNWSITFAETGLDAMTGARVKRSGQYISEDNFMLTYGDGVADIDITKLWEFHKRHGKIGTVTGVRPISRYGELAIEGGRVREFSEKPQDEEGYISGGFFIFQRRFFDYLRADDDCVLEREFKVPACGGFEISEYVPGMDRYFDLGKEIVAVRSPEEWFAKIDHYPRHEGERKQIQEAGTGRVLREHT